MRPVIYLEAVLILIAAVAPSCLRLIRRRLDFFEPQVIIAAYYTVLFSFRPLYVLLVLTEQSRDDPYFAIRPSDESMALTLLYALIGILFFHAGYFFWRPRDAARGLATPRAAWSSTRVSVVAYTGFVSAAISLLLIYGQISDPESDVQSFGRGRQILAGYGYQSLGLAWLGVVAALLWADHLLGRPRPVSLPVALLGSVVYNSYCGSRANVFNLWLSMFIVYYYLSKASGWLRKAGVALAVAAASVVYTISMQQVRDTVGDAEDVVQALVVAWDDSDVANRLMREFCQFDVFAGVIDVGTDQFPLMLGRSYIDLACQVVPRSLWPDKPSSYSFELGRYFLNIPSDSPPSLVGEMYQNFHVPGVMVGMFLLGQACVLFYRAFNPRLSEPVFVVAYALLLPCLPILLARNLLAGGLLTLSTTAPLVVVIAYMRSGARPAPPGPPAAPRPAPSDLGVSGECRGGDIVPCRC